MEWINYKEQKPTEEDALALYLIEYGWHPNISVIKTAYWNGRTFYNEDWENGCTYKYKNQVRHWFKIEQPKKD